MDIVCTEQVRSRRHKQEGQTFLPPDDCLWHIRKNSHVTTKQELCLKIKINEENIEYFQDSHLDVRMEGK